ncbi:MAG: nucleotide exchange factor GrpE [Blastocatellia bacterium]|nr:nucleotide exchange factor GrpE [Blastocatellia bacterium]MCX7751324.1 nucleotide exchange factor GrpE [Blastocatellia bacterium]MDW8169037.1 nucleotide exchange factor GrpE [Acidobacteriota bacterium]
MKRPEEVKEPTESPVEPTAEESTPDDAHPRVVDKRRFTRWLEEGAPAEAPPEEVPRYPSYVEELQTRLRLSEERAQALERAFQEARERMREEIEAFRQRQTRLLEERVEQRVAHILGPVLDVFDELKRAVRAAQQTENAQALLEGMRAIVALFERRLQQCGITVIAPQNQPFDPSLHEAVEVVEVEPEHDGLVLDVVEPGYRLGETTLIRPARVRVGRARKEVAVEATAANEGPRLESG